ncbi:hypothetical protein FRC08_001682 [Ceratobasidium sp. 394]|nr:hypothetical protein FRC08_001682 [Ceratobasidium sp. 394]
MSDMYTCVEKCPYVTNNHRSFKLHSIQCPAVLRCIQENEEFLERKRNASGNLGAPLDYFRPSKLARKDDVPINPVARSPLSTTYPLLDPETPTDHNDLLNVEPGPSLQQSHASNATPNFPAYVPSLGRLRDENDTLPEAPLPPDPPSSSSPLNPRVRRVILRVRPEPVPYTTLPDSFGQYRIYPSKPRTIPDSACELEDFSDIRTPPSPQSSTASPAVADLIAPCPNVSAFRLQYWHWNEGVKKSESARESLVRDVISQPDFLPSDISKVKWDKLDDALASYTAESATHRASTTLRLSIPPRTPAAAMRYKSEPSLNVTPIPAVQCISLLRTVQLSFTQNNPRHFHYEPYEAYCRDAKTSKTFRMYGEAYESQRMLDMHREVQNLVLDEPCELPRCVAALMIFSDATQLANFGNAKAWPVRVTLGNLSKYERCKPDSKNHYEVGFIPSLPADIQDKIRALEGGQKIPKVLLTHLRRELFHEMWRHLLDDEFLRAWRHGIVIQCADGITRRVFPRIFSYSADYPEKVLLATIRGINSLRPCPRCLTPKSEFGNMGLPTDMWWRKRQKRVDDEVRSDLVHDAREIIYTEGRAVNSKRVEQLLRPHSYVPTNNAFSRRLRYLGFNIFEALTVDFLHEFELGVWKSVFHHILRVLDSTDSRSTAAFNERHVLFRLVPAFGNGTIRPFSEDVSDMTRPAARNYEDILQCIIPALEGLLPPSVEKQILTLLYVLAQWHGLAKLRRHTSASVTALRHTTTRLGHELREFRRYTSELNVYETTKEHVARQQRIRKKAKPRAALTADSEDINPGTEAPELGRRRKEFNLETIKLHALGDHAESVTYVGTTDSVSTQTGELLHRHSKRRYMRTNGREYLLQMGKIQRIETRLSDIKRDLTASNQPPTAQTKQSPTAPPAIAHEDLPTLDGGRSPYQIAVSQKNHVLIPIGLAKYGPDPALKEFTPRLKAHLLARLLGDRYEDELARTSSELARVHFQHDRIYTHQTLKIHYTSYDVRRAQDTVNPNTSKRFVLVPSHRSSCTKMGAHHFWYARVLGIYHANVSYAGSRPKRMDFLWVRWLALMTDVLGGWDTCRLDQVGYFPDSEEYHAFEFVDPIDVIRAVHLIPRFEGGRTAEYLESVDSLAADTRSVGDWKHYYVGRFADRDMLLRFTGMAIGHMTPAYTSESAVGASEDALATGYEYDEELEPGGSGPRQDSGNGHNDDEGAGEVESDEGEDESDNGSDAGSYNSQNEDEPLEDDEDEDCKRLRIPIYYLQSARCFLNLGASHMTMAFLGQGAADVEREVYVYSNESSVL